MLCTHLGSGSNDLLLMPTAFREHAELQAADSTGPLFSFSWVCTVEGHSHIRRVNDGRLKFALFVLIVQATLCQGTNFGEDRFLPRNQAEQVEKVTTLLYQSGYMSEEKAVENATIKFYHTTSVVIRLTYPLSSYDLDSIFQSCVGKGSDFHEWLPFSSLQSPG
jgi:hypothetical protein